MTKYLMVAMGGALGSVLRFWVGGYVSNRLGTRFPYGTFVINRDQRDSVVPDRFHIDALGREDPLEPELEIPHSHWVYRWLQHLLHI
jgi:hypothetical protein